MTFINKIFKLTSPNLNFLEMVIRHLHQSVPNEQIKVELRKLGYVINITPVNQPIIKLSLSLFFVDLVPRVNNIGIFVFVAQNH